MDLITLILSVVIVLLVAYIIVTGRRSVSKKQEVYIPSDSKAVKSQAINLLKSTNCQYTVDSDGDIEFTYQNGNFSLQFAENSCFARLLFPCIYKGKLDKLSAVRSVSNALNVQYHTTKFIVVPTKDGANLVVHIAVEMNPFIHTKDNSEIFMQILGYCFEMRREFSEKLNEALEEYDDEDPDKRQMEKERERYLMASHEYFMRNDIPAGDEDMSGDSHCLGTLIHNILGIAPERLKDVSVHIDNVYLETLHGESAVKMNVLYHILDDDNRFSADNVVYIVTCEGETTDARDWIVNVVVSPAAKDNAVAAFARVNVALMCGAHKEEKPAFSNERKPKMVDFLMACDNSTAEQRKAEAGFRISEAYEALQKKAELTPEQILLLGCELGTVQQSLYWGHQYFLTERYYEAIPLLESAFEEMKKGGSEFSDEGKETVAKTCYMLGFCYSELGQFVKACYYLEHTAIVQNVVYLTEFINCLVNMGDPRALGCVDSYLESFDKNDEMKEEMSGFYNFLRRRKSYILVEKKRYDEAESLLHPMLNEPDNQNFAIDELTYIQSLRDGTPEAY